MKTVAFAKTWRGTQFLFPCIEAIYPHVDKIFFLHSHISWSGEFGNTVFDKVIEWQSNNDRNNKIANGVFSTINQREQYSQGIEYIKDKWNPEYILFFDTDEVHTNVPLLIKQADEFNDRTIYAVQAHTYIKSPLYRVAPPCKSHPICLYRVGGEGYAGIRGCDTPLEDRCTFNNIWLHHFTYVHPWEALKTKLKNTYADKPGFECVDLEKYKTEKWDNLPHAENLHTLRGNEGFYKRVEVINKLQLPKGII